jgi:hypothetical protein
MQGSATAASVREINGRQLGIHQQFDALGVVLDYCQVQGREPCKKQTILKIGNGWKCVAMYLRN